MNRIRNFFRRETGNVLVTILVVLGIIALVVWLLGR